MNTSNGSVSKYAQAIIRHSKCTIAEAKGTGCPSVAQRPDICLPIVASCHERFIGDKGKADWNVTLNGDMQLHMQLGSILDCVNVNTILEIPYSECFGQFVECHGATGYFESAQAKETAKELTCDDAKCHAIDGVWSIDPKQSLNCIVKIKHHPGVKNSDNYALAFIIERDCSIQPQCTTRGFRCDGEDAPLNVNSLVAMAADLISRVLEFTIIVLIILIAVAVLAYVGYMCSSLLLWLHLTWFNWSGSEQHEYYAGFSMGAHSFLRLTSGISDIEASYRLQISAFAAHCFLNAAFQPPLVHILKGWVQWLYFVSRLVDKACFSGIILWMSLLLRFVWYKVAYSPTGFYMLSGCFHEGLSNRLLHIWDKLGDFIGTFIHFAAMLHETLFPRMAQPGDLDDDSAAVESNDSKAAVSKPVEDDNASRTVPAGAPLLTEEGHGIAIQSSNSEATEPTFSQQHDSMTPFPQPGFGNTNGSDKAKEEQCSEVNSFQQVSGRDEQHGDTRNVVQTEPMPPTIPDVHYEVIVTNVLGSTLISQSTPEQDNDINVRLPSSPHQSNGRMSPVETGAENDSRRRDSEDDTSAGEEGASEDKTSVHDSTFGKEAHNSNPQGDRQESSQCEGKGKGKDFHLDNQEANNKEMKGVWNAARPGFQSEGSMGNGPDSPRSIVEAQELALTFFEAQRSLDLWNPPNFQSPRSYEPGMGGSISFEDGGFDGIMSNWTSPSPKRLSTWTRTPSNNSVWSFVHTMGPSDSWLQDLGYILKASNAHRWQKQTPEYDFQGILFKPDLRALDFQQLESILEEQLAAKALVEDLTEDLAKSPVKGIAEDFLALHPLVKEIQSHLQPYIPHTDPSPLQAHLFRKISRPFQLKDKSLVDHAILAIAAAVVDPKDPALDDSLQMKNLHVCFEEQYQDRGDNDSVSFKRCEILFNAYRFSSVRIDSYRSWIVGVEIEPISHCIVALPILPLPPSGSSNQLYISPTSISSGLYCFDSFCRLTSLSVTDGSFGKPAKQSYRQEFHQEPLNISLWLKILARLPKLVSLTLRGCVHPLTPQTISTSTTLPLLEHLHLHTDVTAVYSLVQALKLPNVSHVCLHVGQESTGPQSWLLGPATIAYMASCFDIINWESAGIYYFSAHADWMTLYTCTPPGGEHRRSFALTFWHYVFGQMPSAEPFPAEALWMQNGAWISFASAMKRVLSTVKTVMFDVEDSYAAITPCLFSFAGMQDVNLLILPNKAAFNQLVGWIRDRSQTNFAPKLTRLSLYPNSVRDLIVQREIAEIICWQVLKEESRLKQIMFKLPWESTGGQLVEVKGDDIPHLLRGLGLQIFLLQSYQIL
ncbi:hypothetical protein FA15DRAFT_736084 [Coprinopsis marcescibilis]|uniref:Uncharacterized protein n=1 Tax=Coprinopsis marcescibilis TaxID=230819 RepID=A0A5C3KBH2_COPMA|nr:hypothetical protein FA15DRAFT_736084 [Coprinopsis marcescibilis]